jgi:putative ABC transport system substrate-binding protein
MSLENFRAAMRERGWIEGENYSIEVRSGTAAQGAGLATELLKAKVDLIVAPGGLFFTARSVTGDTPLIFGINGDPVVAKIVASYSRPGGNVTGVSSLSAELSGKRLELLKEAAPGLTRFAALANQTHPGVQTEFEATHAAAKRLGIDVKWFPVYAPAEIPAAFEAMTRENSQALAAIPDNMINLQAKAVADFSVSRGMPTISGWAEFAEAGNLLSYGPTLRGFYRHFAHYADKILKGAKPADLPVEQPTVFEFVVNMKTAKALGLNIPRSLLVRADRVIE